MNDLGEKLKKGYSFLHNKKIKDAQKVFNEVFKELSKLDYKNDSNLKDNYINCLLGLGEVYMKLSNFNKSLEYYILGRQITGDKDFNILFNLGVVYRNLGRKKESMDILEKAKKLEPKNVNLLMFLGEMSEKSNPINNGKDINNSFKNKIQSMINNLKR